MNSGGSILLSALRISKSKKRDLKLSGPLNRYTLAHDMTPMNKFSRSYLFRFTISTVQIDSPIPRPGPSYDPPF